jgi:Lon protease-like protein
MDFADPVLTELPLFPLQSVLFPGGLLPLRIFEVRYLDMIGRAHRDGTPFGVVSLTEGAEVRRAPAPGSETSDQGARHDTFHAIGTLAHITELTRPQPGLMMIRCTGGSRFRLARSEQLRHGLWVGQASLLPPDADMSLPEDLRIAEQTLQQLVRQVREQVGEAALPLQGPWRWDDCGWVANRWCELLPLEAAQKQRLMELDSPLLRLELVVDEIKRLKIDQRLAPD